MTLRRPTDDEEDLQNLTQIPKSKIRQQFKNDLDNFKKVAFELVSPKSVYHKSINGTSKEMINFKCLLNMLSK